MTLPLPDRRPLSAWTVSSIVLLGTTLLGFAAGVALTIALFARETPEGVTEEAWAEFIALFLSFRPT